MLCAGWGGRAFFLPFSFLALFWGGGGCCFFHSFAFVCCFFVSFLCLFSCFFGAFFVSCCCVRWSFVRFFAVCFSFFSCLWWFLSLSRFLRALLWCFALVPLSAFVARARSFLLLRFGLVFFLPFLRLLRFPAAALVVCALSLVPRFLRLLFFLLGLLVAVAVLSLRARLLWCARLLLPLVRCGFLFLRVPALLGCFLRLRLRVAFGGLVRGRGLLWLLRLVRAFLLCFGFLPALFLRWVGALFRLGLVSGLLPLRARFFSGGAGLI